MDGGTSRNLKIHQTVLDANIRISDRARISRFKFSGLASYGRYPVAATASSLTGFIEPEFTSGYPHASGGDVELDSEPPPDGMLHDRQNGSLSLFERLDPLMVSGAAVSEYRQLCNERYIRAKLVSKSRDTILCATRFNCELQLCRPTLGRTHSTQRWSLGAIIDLCSLSVLGPAFDQIQICAAIFLIHGLIQAQGRI